MRIIFYGNIAERLGAELDHAPAASLATIGDLRRSLAAAFPDQADLLLSPRLRAFVADRAAADSLALDGVTSVEFLPPVSGG